MRARTHFETIAREGARSKLERNAIIVSELPYQVRVLCYGV
jgi:DNA gyrase/topoisomerase IV subunit A